MKKIKNIEIQSLLSLREMETHIKNMSEDGYELLGSCQITTHPRGDFVVSCTMVKYEEEEPETEPETTFPWVSSPSSYLYWQENRPDNKPKENEKGFTKHIIAKFHDKKRIGYWRDDKEPRWFFFGEKEFTKDSEVEKWAYIPE